MGTPTNSGVLQVATKLFDPQYNHKVNAYQSTWDPHNIWTLSRLTCKVGFQKPKNRCSVEKSQQGKVHHFFGDPFQQCRHFHNPI